MAILLVILIMVIVIVIGIILLQIQLSKAKNKLFGLILPILFLCLSIVFALSGTFYISSTIETGSTTENGEIIREIIEEPISNLSSADFGAILIFGIYNIPTVILLAIYARYRGKNKKNMELKKMSIQDLE